MGTMLENMGEKQSGFHIDVGILDNDACALEMISLLLRQRDGDTYWLERYECAIHVGTYGIWTVV